MDPTVALNMWESNRTGPLTEATGHQILWARIPSNAGVFKKFSDPAAGRNTAHLEVALTSFGDLVGAFIVLLTPHSRELSPPLSITSVISCVNLNTRRRHC